MQYGFMFSEEQVNLILKGLGELPAKESLQTIGLIQQEAQKQQREAKKKEPPKASEEPATEGEVV